jgi:hypothetical protein
MAMFKQILTLVGKNFLIQLGRHPFATVFRAFILPVAFMTFLAWARYLFISPSTYGIGSPKPILTLREAYGYTTNNRNRLVLINSGHSGGAIDQVIDIISKPLLEDGRDVVKQPDTSTLTALCPSTLRGNTPCFGAVEFYGSPTEGPNPYWNYSLRADGYLGAIGELNVELRPQRTLYANNL